MPTDVLQLRVKPELKKDAEELFNGMGLSLPDAIRLFIQQALNYGGLPFQPIGKQPNQETQKAMREINEGGGECFTDFKSLFDSWK